MAQILNLTQHRATIEQIDQGVFDLPEETREELTALLTITVDDVQQPEVWEVERNRRVTGIIGLIPVGTKSAMIDGYLPLMFELACALWMLDIRVLKSHSERVSTERIGPDGAVIKTMSFRHLCFVDLL